MDSSANLHHPNPAQKVGQMRVSTKSNRRKSITSQSTKTSEENHDEAGNNKTSSYDDKEQKSNNNNCINNETTNIDDEEAQQTKKNNNAGPAAVDPILVRDLKDRYARDLQAHIPLRNPKFLLILLRT
jgi:hypothetical protein